VKRAEFHGSPPKQLNRLIFVKASAGPLPALKATWWRLFASQEALGNFLALIWAECQHFRRSEIPQQFQ
jgi:hypothetical protein